MTASFLFLWEFSHYFHISAGKSYRLKASYAKGDSVKKCKSSNKKVATVSKKGVISARQAGKVRITIYTKSGKKATCKVTVTAKKKISKKSSIYNALTYLHIYRMQKHSTHQWEAEMLQKI